MEIIYAEAQRASSITANLLSFAHSHESEKSPISLNEVIEKSLELKVSGLTTSNIEVVTELDRDLPRIMADFQQMQHVFVNIITNAEQAMTAAHGRGTLSTRTRKVSDTIQITLTDNGPGIPEDDLGRLFDPFFTTRDVGDGPGLGLSICFGIVQEHGGSICATSKLGEGTTLTVELPIVPEGQLPRERAESAEAQGK